MLGTQFCQILFMHRLNFRYAENIAQFVFIPWILSQCSSLVEVRRLLERINIVNTPFSEQLPLAQLHWIISDENESITE